MDQSFVSKLLSRSALKAWTQDDKIPWNEPDFSQRMLEVHLDQETGLASRPSAKIDLQCSFIHDRILGGRPSRILDLGCGPGLYSHRLSALGHSVRGIDFSPASIDYARSHGEGEFDLGDLLDAEFGDGFDLVTFLFGEPNTFSPSDLEAILAKASGALNPGGKILLEVTRPHVVRAMGRRGSTWFTSKGDLFHPGPHLLLQESGWDEGAKAAKTRWHIVPEQGEAFTFGSTTQRWSGAEMGRMLRRHGFMEVETFPSMTGEPDPDCPEATVWLGIKPSDGAAS